jgi:hypothetical protein
MRAAPFQRQAAAHLPCDLGEIDGAGLFDHIVGEAGGGGHDSSSLPSFQRL